VIKHTTNENLSAVIVKLFGYAESLRHIHHTKQGSGSLGRETRTSSPLHDLLKRILELKRDVGIRVREARQAAPHGSNNLSLHQTQSALQLSRPFNGSLLPADEALRKCPYCNHDSVNFVRESLSFQDNNETVLREYHEKMEVWDKYQREKERAEGSSNRAMPSLPKGMKMKPRAPGKQQLQQIQARCACSSMHCTQQGSDIGSTCNIKCRHLPVGPRYQWDEFEGCMCTVCKCQCNKIWNVKDAARIVLALAQQSNVLSRPEPSTGTQLQALLGGAMINGIRAASDAFGPAASDADEVVVQNRAIDATSESICRQGRSNLTQKARSELRSILGRSTRVELPSGDHYDTRNLGRGNSHMHNNRLPTVGPSSRSAALASHPPGMADNLNPSYDGMCPQFVATAKKL